MAAFDCNVLVSGAGPAGMTLGLLLARSGISTIVVDKEADIYQLPRAAHIDHEILRIFQELGVGAEAAASCRAASRYDFLTAKGEVLLRFEGMDGVGPGGWPASNMVHQPSLEALLRRAAKGQAHLQLKTSTALVSFEEEADGLTSLLRGPDGDRAIRSRYLVGADGARSRVREAAGIAYDDLNFDERWLVIDTLVHDATRLPDVNLQICDPARPTTCVLMGSGRHRWEFMLKPEESFEQIVQDDVVAGLLAPWNVEGAVSVERKAVYRFNAMVAAEWRKGRVMLAGDAAHLMPPFAGQGLCSGMRDVANLAWKLAAVLRGADEGLLDTYQSEREPHVRGIIALAIMMGRTVCVTDPEAARLRDEQMLAARAAGAPSGGTFPMSPLGTGCLVAGSAGAGTYFPQFLTGNEKLDDLLGCGALLITRTAAPEGAAGIALSLDDARLAPFRGAVDAWLAKQEAEAVLVRPDHYIFGTGHPDTLRDAWQRWTG